MSPQFHEANCLTISGIACTQFSDSSIFFFRSVMLILLIVGKQWIWPRWDTSSRSGLWSGQSIQDAVYEVWSLRVLLCWSCVTSLWGLSILGSVRYCCWACCRCAVGNAWVQGAMPVYSQLSHSAYYVALSSPYSPLAWCALVSCPRAGGCTSRCCLILLKGS